MTLDKKMINLFCHRMLGINRIIYSEIKFIQKS